VADGVERRGAVARDRRAGRLLRELLGEQDDDPGDVERLKALRHAAAAVDVLDQLGIDVRVALEELVHDIRGRLLWAELGERPLEGAPDGRADCVDDHGFRHAEISLGSGKSGGDVSRPRPAFALTKLIADG
jgi:hypothetical protein